MALDKPRGEEMGNEGEPQWTEMRSKLGSSDFIKPDSQSQRWESETLKVTNFYTFLSTN